MGGALLAAVKLQDEPVPSSEAAVVRPVAYAFLFVYAVRMAAVFMIIVSTIGIAFASFTGYAGMDIGRDNGLVVDRGYADKAPFAFTGTVKKAVFGVAPNLDVEDEHALHELAARAHTARGSSAQ